MQGISDFINGIIQAPVYCLVWIIVGIIAGALARRLLGARDRPWWNDLLLGLVGAAIGGLIARAIPNLPTDFLPLLLVNLALATVGAAILILIGRVLRGGRR